LVNQLNRAFREIFRVKPALPVRAGKIAQRLDGLDHTMIEMRERSRRAPPQDRRAGQ